MDRRTEIENTTKRMKEDPAEALLWLGEAMVHGNDAPILRQERDGQRQLVNSDQLPSDIRGDRAEFERLGFTFGEPDSDDPMFLAATLPEGWRREGSDHAMWSHVVDQHGRRRVSIFYKAAFYDRSAFMSLVGLDWYVTQHVEYGEPLTVTDEWATPETVPASMARCRDYELGEARKYRTYAQEAHRPADNRAELHEIAERHEATAAKYEARLAGAQGEGELPGHGTEGRERRA